MEKIISWIDNFSEKTGKISSWIVVVLVAVVTIDVIIRYIFNFSFIWIIEFEIYLFGFMFLLSSGYTFRHDKHVRVDVFYARMSERGKAWINLIGGLFLLAPWCIVSVYYSWQYAFSSFLTNEGSSQPGGLPALYILKFSISIGVLFLLLQCIVSILKSLQIILNKKN